MFKKKHFFGVTKFIDNSSKGVNNQESESIKSALTEEEMADDSETKARLYPNPTKGLLRIEVLNMPLRPDNELRLYDLSGTELLVMRDFENNLEINISNYKDGTYILRMRINKNMFTWKVIKSSY